MYLYNISIIIEESAHVDALNWINATFMPDLQLQYKAQLLSLLDSPHEGHTYCVQIKFDEQEAVENFKNKYLNKLQTYLVTQHPERAFIFDSTMQYI